MAQRKIALVTGAARGIGLAIAHQLGRDGYEILLVDVLEEVLSEAAQGLNAEGIICTPLALDLGQPEQIEALPARVGDRWYDVCALVNNAAISLKREGRRIPIEEITLVDWERVVCVNLTAPFLLTQQVLKPMRARRWGRIVNISSKAGRTPSGVPGVDYVSTKTAIIGLSRGVAKEVAADGITVNSIAPGRIRTTMGNNIDEETRVRILSEIPVRRMGEPEEIASLVSYLVSERAAFVTGAVLDINGGSLMI